jgi:fatty-acyl-CoA synthase
MNGNHSKLSYVHRGGATPLLGATIWSVFEKTVAEYPQAEALVSIPQGRRFTYAELHQEITNLAKALIALKIERGDRVGIWSTNNFEWVLLQMATAHIGVILVNINPAYLTEELHHALSRACVQVLFLIPSFRTSQYVKMVCELCPEAKKVGSLANLVE